VALGVGVGVCGCVKSCDKSQSAPMVTTIRQGQAVGKMGLGSVCAGWGGLGRLDRQVVVTGAPRPLLLRNSRSGACFSSTL
jgi:hypothetical protein